MTMDSTRAVLAKYARNSNEWFVDHTGEMYIHCEPYTGNLPSNLKDN